MKNKTRKAHATVEVVMFVECSIVVRDEAATTDFLECLGNFFKGG